MKPGAVCTAAALAAIAVLLFAATPAEEALQRHRNLGKAFYENPTTHAEAIAEFKKALDLAPTSVQEKLNYALALLRGGRAAEAIPLLVDVQKRDPKLPHTWFNLAIYYKQSNEPEKSKAQFEQFIKLVPNEPIGHYQLGTLLRAEDRRADAEAQFRRAAELDPQLAAAHFQLYNLYRTGGRPQDAARELATFQELKKKAEGAAVPEDVDWCNYAEIYDPGPASGIVMSVGTPVREKSFGPADGFLAIDSTGSGQGDLLTWSNDGLKLYRRGLDLVADSGLEAIRGVISAAAGDFDNDGLMDLCILTESGPLLYRNTKGKFVPVAADLPKRRFTAAAWMDYDHDYDLDLLLFGDQPALMRNQGTAGFADRTSDFPFVPGRVTATRKLRTDPDSKAFDLAVLYDGHAPVLYRDRMGGQYTAQPYEWVQPPAAVTIGDWTRVGFHEDHSLYAARYVPPRHWIRIQLAGVKSVKLAQDAWVEVKAGTMYQRQMYEGVPLFFDLGPNPTVDAVRITWPNGLIQNETNQAANKAYRYEEAQRLSGSCPMIWTWNGRGFEFITDVLGVAPLGASDGEGSYFPTNHVEYVTIPASSLKARDGRYEIRITEELSEVSYLDQVELLAVDHPASEEVYTNEKFKSPPYPEFRLYPVSHRIYPTAAHDDHGRDVRELVLNRDRRYPDTFSRTELGVAEPHTLELEFPGVAEDAVLLLNGWVDWPDGSTFRAISQAKKGGLVMPYLQLQDARGQWVTVNEDMGMPAGKPKTIAVPVHFISASHKVRIVTDLCVYWDEVFLSEGQAAFSGRAGHARPLQADLHFRGFSATRIDPERKQPDTFLYDQVSLTSYWNPTPGMYTRYGDVRAQLAVVDDEFVIMGSGDEVTLEFDASGPPPPAGWTRDFLLKVDGWAKDRDANTASGTSVEPLPFHAMSRYPYPDSEHFPVVEKHYSRPALRLIRSLDTGK
jgi:tetratricopeptide (TPR) repeat protein